MYTLRVIKDNVQTNFNLGQSYSLVERHTTYEKFCNIYKSFFNKEHVADLDTKSCADSKETYAFIVCRNGIEIIPLYKYQSNYIMSENGKTFSNLTFK